MSNLVPINPTESTIRTFAASPRGGDASDMNAVPVPAGSPDALDLLESLMGSLAGTDPAELAQEEKARRLRVLERVDAIGAAVRARLLEAFDAQDGPIADGQRTSRAWLVHVTR